MKKLIFKTVFITFGVLVILAVSVFGIASLFAPVAMMEFTASLGLTGISGDYAFQEYERSGDIACLARAFIISADLKNDRTAETRFSILYDREDFGDFCEEQNKLIAAYEGMEGYTYRAYVCGLAACVRYRLADNDAEQGEVIEFAFSETEASFPQGNPLILLTVEAAAHSDSAFCSVLLEEMQASEFDRDSTDYQAIINILERATRE